MKIFLKILTIITLTIINIVLCIFVLHADKTLNSTIATNNGISLILNSFIVPNENGNFSLLYFYNKDSLQTDKLNEIKNFTQNPDVQNILNFKEIELDGTNTEKYLIYSTLTKTKGSNTILLMNRSGYTILSFSPEEDISNILNELKDIFKNYI